MLWGGTVNAIAAGCSPSRRATSACGRVTTEQSVLALEPRVPLPRAGRLRRREGRLEVERLGAIAPLVGVEAPQKLPELVATEARERGVKLGGVAQLGRAAARGPMIEIGSASPRQKPA